MSGDVSGEYVPPAPEVVSVARAKQEQEWLLARLRDLGLDAKRLRDHAARYGWPDVALLLNEAVETIGSARTDLSLIGGQP